MPALPPVGRGSLHALRGVLLPREQERRATRPERRDARPAERRGEQARAQAKDRQAERREQCRPPRHELHLRREHAGFHGEGLSDTPMKRVRVNAMAAKLTPGRPVPPSSLRGTSSSASEPSAKGMPSLSSTPTASKFAERENKGKVEVCHNEALAGYSRRGHHAARPFNVTLLDGQVDHAYRYMFEKLAQKATVLDQQIEQQGAIISEAHQLMAWCHPGVPSQSEMTVVGRICCDSDARLNESSVVIEASTDAGQGARVRLRLDSLASFALFPGQIVGLQGINNTGEHFMATRLFTMPPLTVPKTPFVELREYHMDGQGNVHQPIAMAIAAGPYTLDDNLQFEPLRALLGAIEKEQPDMLIMVGVLLCRTCACQC
ncbi:hypothetical protein SYNPS1DRAFT_30291 [Syncephalis pseudoplumigaleata]|uniref:DNA polymerase alpha subunit B OB domain-containing protein n=1 Tax=Syncephalis pseudoplumigaleata TaxID=1712513 RepID=A0A4P9YVA6_9FUNG|nr:hypothetical protein SYNPS1DRAFT_30291 [Syncephalis pseudoplumigaleata]|eukprot:RKP23937.1 hypothetical protein SYNPS1DRAFT_30291 [Syncephalis pseudoplumigaleata]